MKFLDSFDLSRMGAAEWPQDWNVPDNNPFQMFGMYYWYDEGYEIHGPYEYKEDAQEDLNENINECLDYAQSLNNYFSEPSEPTDSWGGALGFGCESNYGEYSDSVVWLPVNSEDLNEN